MARIEDSGVKIGASKATIGGSWGNIWHLGQRLVALGLRLGAMALGQRSRPQGTNIGGYGAKIGERVAGAKVGALEP